MNARRLKTCQMFLSKNQHYQQFGPFPDVPLSSRLDRVKAWYEAASQPSPGQIPY